MHAPRKEPFQRPRPEYPVQEFQHRLSVDIHVVAVGDEDFFAREGHHLRRGADLHPALTREVVADPHVVVAREEDHPHAPVRQLGQFPQRAHEALGHHTAVFEPEIENVADQKYRFRIAGDLVEPRHEASFDRPCGMLVTRPQMYVGCEIIHYFVSSSSFSSRLLP